MNFIKRVHEKNFDEEVHQQFQKFSKGEFRNRALIEAKNSNGNYIIKTSAEFANGLVKELAERLGSNKTKVTGGIITTINLKEIPKYHDLFAQVKVKNFQGVKNYQIDLQLSGKEIIEMINTSPKAFFALSFSVEEDTLKIKPKAPKSGKPGSKGEEAPKVDFCVLKTKDKNLAESFIFENPEFKIAKIAHDFLIDKIEIPNELKNSEDFALIREKSKRVGKILRKAEVDGVKSEKELELKA